MDSLKVMQVVIVIVAYVGKLSGLGVVMEGPSGGVQSMRAKNIGGWDVSASVCEMYGIPVCSKWNLAEVVRGFWSYYRVSIGGDSLYFESSNSLLFF